MGKIAHQPAVRAETLGQTMKSEHIAELRHLLASPLHTIGSSSGDRGPIYGRGSGASGTMNRLRQG
jgi:hypothetical protein